MSDLNLTVQEGDDIYLSITETPAVVTLSQAVISGALASTVTVSNTVTVALDANSLAALESVTVTVGNVTIGSSVSISNFPASQQVSGTVTANSYRGQFIYATVGGIFSGTFILERVSQTEWYDSDATVRLFQEDAIWKVRSENEDDLIATHQQATVLPPKTGWTIEDGYSAFSISYEQPFIQPISGTVTVGNSVTIGSLPVNLSTTTIGGTARLNVTLSSATTVGGTAPSYANLYGGSDGTNLRAISVDTSGRTVVTGSISVANLPSTQTVAGTVTANISGTVPVSGTFWQATQPVSLASLPSSTVTVAAMPNGTLTTRFGSVITANTAQITTAVTNTSRKYLLIQNVTTASNVITVGIGFTPTTTQGIQLAAGAGITFEASYIPTGAVWVLSSVTASNYTILEA